ncbi:MAG TPA: FtsX-like permease family protein [bacterium]|nr:FtsX-like permease family protein [bacterium]
MRKMHALLTLIFASLRGRLFATTVSILAVAVALAVVAVTGIVSFAIAKQAFESGRKYPLIVAAEGSSETQIILSTIFHIDKPRGKIPFETYETLKKDPRVTAVFPIAAADSVGVFPIIGTDGAFVADLGVGYRGDIALADPHDAVLGATVARQLLMDVGTEFTGTHGMGGSADEAHEHADHTYIVKGILDPTGGPEDAAVYTSYKAVWEIHGEKGHKGHEGHKGQGEEKEDHDAHHDHVPSVPESDHDHDRYHLSDGMLTAVLARTGNPVQVFDLQQEYSKPGLTAVNTAGAVRSFQKYFNTAGLVATFFAGLTLLIAAALILAITLMALDARRRELALLRILGIGRGMIAVLIMLETLIVTVTGVVIGFLLGHGIPSLFAADISRWVGASVEPWHIGANELPAIIGALLLGQAVALIAMLRAYRMDLVEESGKN